MRRLWTLTLVTACAPGAQQPDPVDVEMHSSALIEDEPGLALGAVSLWQGERVAIEATGYLPGDDAALILGINGLATGPCPPRLDGACLGLAVPLRVAAEAVADVDGVAVFYVDVPNEVHFDAVWAQAVRPDVDPAVSNAVELHFARRANFTADQFHPIEGSTSLVVDAHGLWATVLEVRPGDTYRMTLVQGDVAGGSTERGSVDVPYVYGWAPHRVVKVDQRAYVAGWGIDVIDADHMMAPAHLANVPTVGEGALMDLDLAGGKLVARGTNGLALYDLSDPDYPTHTGTMAWWTLGLEGTAMGTAGRAVVRGDRYFLAVSEILPDGYLHYLAEVDVSGTSPVLVSLTPSSASPSPGITHVTDLGDVLLLGTEDSNGHPSWTRFDVSTAGDPVVVGGAVPGEGAWGIEAVGTRVFTTSANGRLRLQVWDLAADTGRLVGQTDWSWMGHHNVDSSDSRVWVTGEGPRGHGLYVFNR